MKHQHHTHESRTDGPCGGRARSRWWAVGLAGMTGLALTATVAVATPVADAVGRATVADDRLGKPDRPQGGDHRDEGKGEDASHVKKPTGTPVPCSTGRLIAAITLANARGGAVLDLAKKCTYLLTADIDGAGLPAITTPITLNGGKNTTIKRAAAADDFRILTVNANGRLTLNHLTITGGRLSGDNDGGGILINSGGGATVDTSKFVANVSVDGDAGAIMNNGGVLDIRHSIISRNTAANIGGAIFSIGQLVVDKSRFDANAALTGGAITISGDVTITRSELVDHQAAEGGAVFFLGGSTGKITDTRFARNTATNTGGSAISGGPTQLTMSRVTLANNTTTGAGGGALFLQGGSALVEDSVIKNNVGTNGGGIRNLGGLTLLRTQVTGNQATESGGGILNEANGVLALLSTKVVKNVAGTDGGGIFNAVGGTVDLNTATGTIVAKNRPNNCTNVPDCPD
ncbi:right-handed parallel beta-helix repeat-containing protein [Salinispora arenicola]|uniref:right-handed parallel beta-helix repeat-containing protein n=1 Tax=Salinispora arenicola TaxID=168697 RepID=UPI00207AC305|nr:right-handed parallel beta-helix repeat-containing protein [Salinispora arenicola]MCN0181353.1 right-handed parallel beta-helix repeat-containing protein [Salinispora arenicola]